MAKFSKKARKIVVVKTSRRKKNKKISMKKKTVAKIAKQVYDRQTENKHREFSAGLALKTFLSGNQDANVIPLSPFASFLDIQQGVADGGRIGNRLKIKNAAINFSLFPNGYNASTNITPIPQNVMFVIFYDRLNPTQVPSPTANGDFYQANGSTTGFTGRLYDEISWINFDRYKVVYKRLFKLGFQLNQGSGADANNAQWANNDYKLNYLNFKVNYTKWLIKNVKYNDNNSTPTTRGLFAMWISVPANNSQFGSTQAPMSIQYQTAMSYEDA